jgi:hypothetical protein
MTNSAVTSSQLFYNKLNEANPQLTVPLSPTNITVGAPSVNTDTSISKNSMVSIAAKAGTSYSGLTTAYYDRVSMADILDSVPGANVFPLTTETMIADVLPIFNTTFGINMVAADIITGNLPAADPATGQIAFTLAANATSLAFVGSIPITYVPADLSLAVVVAQPVLTGPTAAAILSTNLPLTQALLSQVNSNNPGIGRFLTNVNVTAAAPIVLSGDASNKNTSVVLTGIAGKGFANSVTIKYDRVGLADLIAASANPSNILPAAGQTSLSDFVTSFNTRYGAKLSTSDVTTSALATLPGGYQGVTMTPVDGHLLFNAGTVLKYPGSYATLTLTGTFATPSNVGSAYSSTIAIAGGNGIYENVRLATGAVPAGLSLSIVNSTVSLAGNSTTMGTFAFTVRVDSDDGQTANSVTQTIVIDGELDLLITNPTLTGLVSADAVGKASGPAFFSRLNADNPTLPVALSASNVAITAITALSGDASLRNTSLVVTGSSGGYVHAKTIKYNRLDFATVITGHVPAQSWTTQASSSDLLAAINTATGYALVAADIVVEALPTNPSDGSTVNYSIQANATSLAFTGTGTIGLLSQAPAPTIGGSLTPDVTIGTAYSSGLALTGAAPFSNPRLDTTAANATATLPAGLALTISGNNVVLSGTATGTAASAKNYYIAVDTADGETIVSPVQSLQVNRGQWLSFTGGQKHTNITLTGSPALTATRNDTLSGAGVVSAGGFLIPIKHYWEVACIALGNGNTINNWNTVYIGYKLSTEAVASTWPGHQAGTNSVGYLTAQDGPNGHGALFMNNVAGVIGPAGLTGDVIGIACDATDLTAVKLWYSRNGVWMQGNPSTGTLPMVTVDWSAGSYLPAIGTVRGNASGQQAQSVGLHMSPATLTYPAPTGFAKGQAI